MIAFFFLGPSSITITDTVKTITDRLIHRLREKKRYHRTFFALCCDYSLLGCLSSTLEHQVASHHQSSNKSKKVEVIDLTIDSSSDEEEEEPSAKRTCPSLSPTSPLNNKG